MTEPKQEPLVINSEIMPDDRIWMYVYDEGNRLIVYLCTPPNNDFDFLIHGDYKIKDGMIRVHGVKYLKSLLPQKEGSALFPPEDIPYNAQIMSTHAIAPENIFVRPRRTLFWGKVLIREASERVKNIRYAEHNGLFRVFYSNAIILINDRLPENQQ